MPKVKRIAQNRPHHAMGLMGHAREIKPMKAGAKMPARVNTGFHDAKGYQDSPTRRNGALAGTKIPPGDMRPKKGPEGLSKGSPPGGKAGASIAAHKGTAGRGGPARMGMADQWKGKGRNLSEDISHADFEKLGAG